MEVIEDYEAYPDWAEVNRVDVRERAEGGRATEVLFEVDVPVLGKATYVLTYRYAAGDTGLSWTTKEARGAVRDIRGEYLLNELTEDRTKVTYRLGVELGVLVPGFIRTEGAKQGDRERARTSEASGRDGLMRVLLFTGKGGVGKTTIAAATAVGAARAGKRTLVMSTDPAHSSGRLVRDRDRVRADRDRSEPLGPAGRRAGAVGGELARDPGLHHPAHELVGDGLDPGRGAHRHPRHRRDLPLIDVKNHVESGSYDVLVVDCAPTAETLRLLSLPEVMSWYIERIFPVERRIVEDGTAVRLARDHAPDRRRSGVRRHRAAASEPRCGQTDPHRREGRPPCGSSSTPRRW